MAFEQTLRSVGLPAAADLTSGGTVNPQFYFVTVNSSGQINFTGAGAVAHAGVLVTCADNSGSSNVFTVTEGTHDATNVKVTVTTGAKYKVLAWL